MHICRFYEGRALSAPSRVDKRQKTPGHVGFSDGQQKIEENDEIGVQYERISMRDDSDAENMEEEDCVARGKILSPPTTPATFTNCHAESAVAAVFIQYNRYFRGIIMPVFYYSDVLLHYL